MTFAVGTNSYGSVEAADDYFEDSIRNTTWSAFEDVQKEQALVDATRVLDRMVYDGTKTVAAQALQFPRTGLTDCSGEALSSAESLVTISEAEFEYAIVLLGDPSILTTQNVSGTNVKKLEAGSAKITYFRPVNGGPTPILVQDIISCLLAGSAAGTTGSVVSGNTDSSSFTDPDCKFGLNRGYP